jgi:hypothetical protein
MSRKLTYLICIAVLLGLSAYARAQVNVAETLLVDVRAEDLAYGSVTTWPNHGTLGPFTAKGAPVVEDVAGLKAVTFDGASWFDGPTSVPGIEGKGTRTIEVWVYNPTTVGEETMVHWSHRGGPDGTNIAFNYGNNTTWGAVGHWGSPDMPWGGSVSPCPALGKWWHLVYTYDGTTVRLYANGSPAGDKAVALNTHAGNIIRIAAQGDDTGTAPVMSLNFTGSIAQVRIHDGVLTPAQIAQNFKAGGPRKAASPSPVNGAVGVMMPLMTWTPATIALFENVYFGTTPELTAADCVATKQSIMLKMLYYLGPMTPGQKYYWRVDEVAADGTIYTGDTWSFSWISLTAFSPTPPDGAHFQDPNVDLAWLPGKNAKEYDIYFGTDRTEVADGTGGTLKATQNLTSFDLGLLATATTYYWRVDLIDNGDKKHAGDVWSFTTVPSVAVSDPNLVGWWKFDEGEGRLAVDWSGQGQHGQIVGGATWVEGFDGGALKLNGQDGYVDLPIGSLIAASSSITVTTWVNWSGAGGAWQRVFDFGSGEQFNMLVTPANGANGNLRFVITVESYNNEQQLNAATPLPTGWHHVAVAINGATRGMQMFLDGQVVASGSTTVLPKDLGITTQNWIGRSQYSPDAYFRGAVDDFRIYNFAMTAQEIPETMRGDPALAWDPQPARDSMADIRTATELSWAAGQGAAQHDVYFGTDSTAVADADTSSPLYCGRQTATSFPLAGLVEFGGGAYFWRIDEVEADAATIHKGRLWGFTIPGYLIVDDFESYTNDSPKRIFQTWIDGWGFSADEFFPNGDAGNGTGATVGHDIWTEGTPYNMIVETSIVAPGGSKQSMPLAFNNADAPFYSETERTWASPQDFTAYGAATLSLQVHGYPVVTATAVTETGGKMTLTGAGTDIWGTSDEFTFACKTLTGDGSIIAKVVSTGTGTDTWAKGGVMIRDSLDGGSAHAMMVITGGGGNGASFQWRPVAHGDSSNSGAVSALTPPYWVKIERLGDTISASASADGLTWNPPMMQSSVDIPMSDPVYIGLCVTSHQSGVDRTYQFEGIKSTGGVSGQWQGAVISSPWYNSEQSLYIAVQDSAGKSAVASDPNVVNAAGWTELQIPLSNFTGVNMTKVKKMTISVGSRTNPAADGSGTLFIDDIRVVK